MGPMSNSKKTIIIFCGRCGRDTNHHILCERSEGSKKDDDYHWGIDHYFVQCAGCDNYCYALSRWDEDDYWNPNKKEETHWETYPLSKGHRTTIDNSHELPFKVKLIYQEVISSINSKLYLLSAIGLRTLIEAICKDQGVKGKNLEELIDTLEHENFLPLDHAEILHGLRFMGNEAAHEIQRADPDEISAALDIAETIMKTIYISPRLSKKIKTGRL